MDVSVPKTNTSCSARPFYKGICQAEKDLPPHLCLRRSGEETLSISLFYQAFLPFHRSNRLRSARSFVGIGNTNSVARRGSIALDRTAPSALRRRGGLSKPDLSKGR